MDLTQLRTVVAVAEMNGFSAAAHSLNLTQSAVSAQIRRLEGTLGVQLFERTSRSVALTDEGAALLPYARHVLHLAELATTAVSQARTPPALRLGITSEQAAHHLPEILDRLTAEVGDVPVEIECAVSTVLTERLAEGLLDVALTIRHGPGSTGETLGVEPLVWVGPPGIELDPAAPVPLACNPEGCIHRAHAIDALIRAGRSWTVRYMSDSPAAANAALTAGLAIGVKADHAIPDGCADVGTRLGLPDLGTVTVELHRSPTAVSPACRSLVEIVRAVYATLRTTVPVSTRGASPTEPAVPAFSAPHPT